MCDLDEGSNEDSMGRDSVKRISSKCMKCKESPALLIIRVGDAFCRNCFKEYFVHKFRAMLGKNRLVFPGEKVLLAVSGGPSSSSLLFQVQEGLSHKASKKLRFVPGIVHIEEGAACGKTLEERTKIVADLKSIFSTSGFPFVIVYLEEVFSLPSSVLQSIFSLPTEKDDLYKDAVAGFMQSCHTSVKKNLCHETVAQETTLTEDHTHASLLSTHAHANETSISAFRGKFPFSPEQTEAVKKLFASMKTLTAKEEMLQTLRKHLILYTARIKGYSKVMMGDSCTRLAVKLLANICLGRGAFLAMDTGFSDPRHGDITIIRPMREYSAKEIAFYNKLFGVPSVFTAGLNTKAPEKASIQHLTESFIVKLQADFPSTVSTIYRTSEKLNPRYSQTPADDKGTETCLLCSCVLGIELRDEASAFCAISISEELSQSKKPEGGQVSSSTMEECCAENKMETLESSGCSCQSRERRNTTPDFWSLLCYSCKLVVKDMTSLDLLPEYILEEANRRQRRTQIKREIQEYLLTSEDDADTAP
uniref:Cytoplasmic tRNA 2-thiolation protein 2 n=2 Tax=Erpetoichthys calabaricus TaxID=27687 RepID=A0A8C4SIF0_ERPCA